MQHGHYGILMVCMGNICRSPTAEAVLRSHIAAAGLSGAVRIDSAGTHNYHPGAAPDSRSQRHAAQRGYDLASLRARQVTQADYRDFDLLLAMDWDNLALLQADCPSAYQHKLRLLMSFADGAASPVVPDPYYGVAQGFDAVLDLTEAAAEGLVQHLRQTLWKTPGRVVE